MDEENAADRMGMKKRRRERIRGDYIVRRKRPRDGGEREGDEEE